jgi:hypothetical protein
VENKKEGKFMMSAIGTRKVQHVRKVSSVDPAVIDRKLYDVLTKERESFTIESACLFHKWAHDNVSVVFNSSASAIFERFQSHLRSRGVQ